MFKFCAKQDVYPLLPIGANYTAYDSLIDAQIALATSDIQAYTRRDFVLSDHVDYFSTPNVTAYDGMFSVFLKDCPITNGSVSVYLSYNKDWDVPALAATDYSVNNDTGVVTFFRSFQAHASSLKIVYNAGFAVDQDTGVVAVSDDLKQACALQAAFRVSRILDSSIGQESQSLDGRKQQAMPFSVTSITPEAAVIVSKYRRLLVGRG